MKPSSAVCALPLFLCSALPARAQEEAAPERPAAPDRAELEARFAETMTGAILAGHFSDDAAPPDAAPKEDRYTLGEVAKLESGKWRFEALIEYGEKSFTMPIVLDVEWAGDTPVITMTDQQIPLLGTFTVRVLVYADQYVGIWKGAGHGGQMWGRIERPAGEPAAPAEEGGSQGEEGEDGRQVHWPSFHGPGGSGVAHGFPTVTGWDIEAGENVRWRVQVPGLCHSSPIVWGDRIFLTTAIKEGEPAELKVGLYGSTAPVQDDSVHEYRVYCLDKETGRVLWETSSWKGVPAVKRHPKGSHIASTPATDGRHLVCHYGAEGLYCYDLDGKLLWKKDLGKLVGAWFWNKDEWGFGSSPVIHDGKVITQCDVLEGSFVAAFDVATGDELWRTPREDVPTWGTPTVDVREGRKQVICNGWKHIGGYDLETGAELWKLVGGGDIPVPTPIVAHDLVFITNAHGRMAPIYAIDAMAEGEISMDHEAMAWSSTRMGNYMQTPVVMGTHLFLCHDTGRLSCFDAGMGDELFKERLGSGKTGFTASLVGADGKLYATAEDGEVHVARAAPEFELLAVNALGEECMATPAISEGVIYWRTRGHLVAIGE